MLEWLTCPLESAHHLEAARDRKQEKTEYLGIMSEFPLHMGVECYYNMLELSVLGHYLPLLLTTVLISLRLKRTFLNQIVGKYVQVAAAISISSSRRIFLARNCPEWSEDT